MGITLSYSGLGGKVKFSGTTGKFKTSYEKEGLLDLYPNAAAAYSLRKLKKTYTGSAIRVRRSSDNAEQDIAFTGGQLNTTALLTFCGVGNGFVTTWYDQSGNAKNLVQTITAQQPYIVVSGALITRNSKPYIRIVDTTSFAFSTDLVTTNGTNYSLWMLFEKSIVGNINQILIKGGTDYHWLDYGTTQYINSGNNNIVITDPIANVTYLINTITNYGVGATMYRNGTSIGTTTGFGAGAASSVFPGARPSATTITTAEFVFYPTNQDANRLGISANINSFYTLY
jgi:hypothetical protein